MPPPSVADLLRSHAELRAAVRIAGQRIRTLQFGKHADDPVLVMLRAVLREARLVAAAFKGKA